MLAHHQSNPSTLLGHADLRRGASRASSVRSCQPISRVGLKRCSPHIAFCRVSNSCRTNSSCRECCRLCLGCPASLLGSGTKTGGLCLMVAATTYASQSREKAVRVTSLFCCCEHVDEDLSTSKQALFHAASRALVHSSRRLLFLSCKLRKVIGRNSVLVWATSKRDSWLGQRSCREVVRKNKVFRSSALRPRRGVSPPSSKRGRNERGGCLLGQCGQDLCHGCPPHRLKERQTHRQKLKKATRGLRHPLRTQFGVESKLRLLSAKNLRISRTAVASLMSCSGRAQHPLWATSKLVFEVQR